MTHGYFRNDKFLKGFFLKRACLGVSLFFFMNAPLQAYTFDNESLGERYEIIGAITGSYSSENGSPSGVAILRDKTLNSSLTLKMHQSLPGFPGFRLVSIDQKRLVFKKNGELITLHKSGFQGERSLMPTNRDYAYRDNPSSSSAFGSAAFGSDEEGFIIDEDTSTLDQASSLQYREPLPQGNSNNIAPSESMDRGISPSMRMGFGQNNEFLHNLPHSIDAIKDSAQKFHKFTPPHGAPNSDQIISMPHVPPVFQGKNMHHKSGDGKG